MPQSAKYPPELRNRAVRMVADVRSDYSSEQAAIAAVASILGIDSPETLRHWVRRAAGDSGQGSSKWRTLKLIWAHPVIVGSIITVLGGLGLIYSTHFLGMDQQQSPGTAKASAPHVEVDHVSLTPAIAKTSPNGVIFGPFKIDIKLLNTGAQLAAINSARLIIQKSVVLPQCASQGNFTATGAYRANMPTDPSPGQVVSISVSQLVQPGGADRFDLLLQTRLLRNSLGYSVHLYRIHIYLTYNVGTKPLDIGEVLVYFPFAPGSGEYYWSRYYAARPQLVNNTVGAGFVPRYKRCAIKNSYALHSILPLPAMRTSELASIPAQLAY
jgi:hypothetical protein